MIRLIVEHCPCFPEREELRPKLRLPTHGLDTCVSGVGFSEIPPQITLTFEPSPIFRIVSMKGSVGPGCHLAVSGALAASSGRGALVGILATQGRLRKPVSSVTSRIAISNRD